VAAWARNNAADLRRLVGQITTLTNLPTNAHAPIEHLHQALADNDAANLLAPLAATAPHLQHNHPDLATRIETLTPARRTTAPPQQRSAPHRLSL
jgi:predicted ATPase